MYAEPSHVPFHSRLVDALYVEAMLLADEARSYFDDHGHIERQRLAPTARVIFSCESLKVTTCLMHAVAWLLTQRAIGGGELAAFEAPAASRRLNDAPVTDPGTLATLPATARALVEASIDLHRRVARHDRTAGPAVPRESPARCLQDRLARDLVISAAKAREVVAGPR